MCRGWRYAKRFRKFYINANNADGRTDGPSEYLGASRRAESSGPLLLAFTFDASSKGKLEDIEVHRNNKVTMQAKSKFKGDVTYHYAMYIQHKMSSSGS